MRIARKLSTDQETISRFIAVLGSAMLELSGNKLARPGFFIVAHNFIAEYINGGFFKKEELIMKALEDVGFPPDDGPIYFMRSDQDKTREAAAHMIQAAKHWQAGDENARVDVSWAASEFTSTLRQHLDRLKNLIFPLVEQNLALEDEHKIAEGMNTVIFEADMQNDPDKYDKMLETLEEELADWR
jgi:hemerythrin-like domain-containing protein